MQVKFYATLRDVVGTSNVNVPVERPTTVGAVLRDLALSYPSLAAKLWDGKGGVAGAITVMLNGRAIDYLRGLETVVNPGDNLALFPPIGGG